jgi:hypothetical protein
MAAQLSQLTSLIHSFVKALTLQKLYGPGHPLVVEACELVVTALAEAAGDSGALTFGIAKDRLFAGQESLAAAGDVKIGKFISLLHHLGLSHLRLGTRLSVEELGRFLEILTREGARGREAVQDSLRAASILNVTLGLLDYTKVTTAKGGAGEKKKEKLTAEAVWRRLVLPASQAGLPELTAAERSELLGLVEEPELLRELLDRLERLPRRAPGEAGKAEVVDFARHLGRLLRALSAGRRQALVDRLAELVNRRQAAAGPAGGAPARGGRQQGDQALEAMAAALAAEGKPSERLRTTYGEVLAQVAGGKSPGEADTRARAPDYVEGLLLNRSEAPYMSDGYARELETLPGAGSGMEPADGGVVAGLVETLEPRRLSLERARLGADLLKGAANEADIQALMTLLHQTVGSLLREGNFEEAGELLEAVYRFYVLESRTHVERAITNDALRSLDIAPLLEHLLSGRPDRAIRERLRAICNLFASKAAPYLLDRLRREEAGPTTLLWSALTAMRKAVIPELRPRLARASGGYLLRLIALLGAVGGEAEVALLEPLCRRWNEAVRKEAVKALGRIGSRQAIPVLSRVLLARRWPWGQTEVKIEAARALGRIEAEEALEPLLQATRRRHREVASACEEIVAQRQAQEAAA